jgi:type IV pilus assembly protein PilY1
MKSLIHKVASFISVFASIIIWTPAHADVPIAQSPLFIGASARPVVMLAMSRDQELFYKAYPDYSNLKGGALTEKDLTYRNDFEYSGYFDPDWCYGYYSDTTTVGNSYYYPAKAAVDHKCDTSSSSSSSASSVATTINLSSGKTVTAKTISGSNPASNVVDGNNSTYWRSSSETKSWIKIDLGSLSKVTEVVIGWHSSEYASNYKVQVSTVANPNDGENHSDWTNVAANINASSGINTINTNQDARWIRVYGVTSPANRYRISEFRVNGYVVDVPYVEASETEGRWSGNFLNWASMTRMDILRKVLYGGLRSVDTPATSSTPAETILERAFVPKDSHAFVKVYTGTDVSSYTPYTDSSISLCNVSTASNGYPVIRVASDVWHNWSHTEIQQCQWRKKNSGDSTQHLDHTRETSPTIDNRKGEMVVKVKVCVTGKDAEDNLYNSASDEGQLKRCMAYNTTDTTPIQSMKPVGVLQKKYDDINFGLVTGSWARPGEGGVLRKKAGRIAGNLFTGTDTVNEFSETTGVFNAGVKGIIHNINLFRISQFTYTSTEGDKSYSNNNDWRNPIGEIYGETLRYFAGKKSAYFDANDTSYISDLTRVASSDWDDPLPSTSWCSKCSIVLLSSGPNSFDMDNLDTTFLNTINSSLTSTSLNTKIDDIASNEFGATTNKFFMGYLSGSYSAQCQIGDHKLSALRGFCPESPTTKGGYGVSGLAYWAKTNDLRSGYTGSQAVNTYAVELSEGLPTFDIPVGAGKVSIVPVCTNNTHANECSLVGVRVEKIVTDTASGNPISGQYLFYWEDQPWASDYDMDSVQRIEFCVGTACSPAVNSDQIKITNSLPYWATGTGRMHMSYLIEGTTSTVVGVQTGQWLTRAGYDNHSLTGQKVQNPTQWYDVMDATKDDNVASKYPANDESNASSLKIYYKQATYTKSTATLASSLTNLQTPLFYAAKYGGFTDLDGNGIPNKTEEWDVTNIVGAASPDGIPDNYFVMKNPSLLEARLTKIFDEAGRDSATGSGVSTNSTRLDTVTQIYQAIFYPPRKDNSGALKSSWHGEVRALRYSKTLADFDTTWTTMGKVSDSTGRSIYSYNPTDKKKFEFTNANWNELSATQKTALGGDIVGQAVQNWVRGDDVSGYRTRLTAEGVKNLVGDIVNSSPVYAGADSQGYETLATEYGSGDYQEYLDDVKANRPDILYVGANDGMLHGFRTDCTATPTCGTEVLAYVPSTVYDKLPALASTAYGAGTAHAYMVDGSIYVGDAYIDTGDGGGKKWRSILVGAMGAGARGIFVLDVTDPENFDEQDVLFEITAADYPQIGNVMGKIYIAPVNGRWSIILGNGYNSTDDKAYLMMIDLESFNDPEYSGAIPTNTAANNGLAGPALYRASSAVPYQYAYAGDYLGNMWKFDIAAGFKTAKAAYGSSPDYTPLFIAKSDTGVRQPITAEPTLGIKSGATSGSDAIMVFFGTGSYMTSSDASSTPINSFYGIADSSSAVAYTSLRSEVLHKKSMTVLSGGKVRDIDDMGKTGVNPVNWAVSKGWYLDFPSAERIITKPTYVYDRLLFSTVIPNSDTCTFGGSGWLMELVGVGDKYANSFSLLENYIRSNYSILETQEASGMALDFFIPGELVYLAGNEPRAVACDITGTCKDIPLTPPSEKSSGRISWRQIK